MTRRLLGVCTVGLFFALACNGITYPTGPTIEQPSAVAPTNILLTATPERLPVAGGDTEIRVRVVRRTNTSDVGVPGVVVKLSSTEGNLGAGELTTNGDGEGLVRWSTTKTGTVIARAGELNGNVTIALDTAIPAPVPPTTPTPTPRPTPQPPTPVPTPPPQAIPITLTANPSPATAGATVTWTAAATIPASEGVLRQYEWSFDGGAAIINGQSAMTQTYATTGAHTASVTVRSTTWASGTATGSVTVNTVPAPTPAVAVTLTATPQQATVGTPIAFTATETRTGAAGNILSYEWDWDTSETTTPRETTSGNTKSFTYLTTGTRTARVTVTTTTGLTASANVTVAIVTP